MAFFVRVPLGNWFFQKGIEAKREWRLEKAANYFGWASFFSKSNEAIYEKAICYQLRGKFNTSQFELDKLPDKDTKETKLRAKILNASGVNRFNQNHPDEALNLHSQSLELAKKLNDSQLQAEVLIDLSRVQYHTKGNHTEALKNLETALEISRELKNETIEADALRNIGVVRWWFKGELDAPLKENYLLALELYRKNKNLRGEAITLSNISFIYNLKGDLYKFLQIQNESIAIKEKIGDLAGLSESYSALGTIYLIGEQKRKAQEHFEKSLEILKETGYALNQNEVETYLARIHFELDQYDTAIDLTQKLLEREGENTVLAKYRTSTLGEYHFYGGELEKALKLFQTALEIERKTKERDFRSEYSLLNYLGKTYLELNNLENAQEFFDKARLIDEKREVTDINRHLRPYVFQADFWQKKGKPEKAFDLLNESAEFESKVFASHGTNFLVSPETRDYDELFILLLDRKTEDEELNQKSAKLAFSFFGTTALSSFSQFYRSSKREKSDYKKCHRKRKRSFDKNSTNRRKIEAEK